MPRYDWLSVTTADGGAASGLTLADRTKIRSRAAKTDPFEDVLARSRKTKVASKMLDEQHHNAMATSRRHTPALSLQSFTPRRLKREEPSLRRAKSSGIATPHETDNEEPDIKTESTESRSGNETSSDLVPSNASQYDFNTQVTMQEYIDSVLQACKEVWQNPVLKPYLSASRVDPFWTFPIKYRACLPIVIHHEVNHLTPPVPGLDIGEERALLRWFAIGVDESAHLYANLAFAAAHLIDAGSNQVTEQDVLYLKHSAIIAVNRALQDPRRGLSSGIIGAVMGLAVFEFTFGDTESYDAHIAGARKMIELRGGMDKIEAWLAHFLRFTGGSSACWKIYWPYSRQVEGLQALIPGGDPLSPMLEVSKPSSILDETSPSSIPGESSPSSAVPTSTPSSIVEELRP